MTIVGCAAIIYAGLWWLTERSQSKFGKEHRAWREEKAMKPIREETEKVRAEAKEETEKVRADAEEANHHTRSLMWWQHGAR